MGISTERALAIASRHNLPEAVAELLTEHDEADAERLAAFVEAERGRNDPTTPVDPLTDLFTRRAAHQRDWLESLGCQVSSTPKRNEGAGFDGGVRDPAPAPEDPHDAHNDLIVDLASAPRSTHWGDDD